MSKEGDQERRAVVSESRWREEYVDASPSGSIGDERALVVVQTLNSSEDC